MPKTPYHKETGAMLGEIISESDDGIVSIKNRFDKIITLSINELIFDSLEAEKIARQYNNKNKKNKPQYRHIEKDIPLWISNFVGFFHIVEGLGIFILLFIGTDDYKNYALFGGIAVVSIIIGINLLRFAKWSWFASVIFNILGVMTAALFVYERFHLMDFNIRYIMLMLWPAVLLRLLFRSRDNFRG